ncbi:MAG: Bax inhibitor-1 family protein [Spirochaetota bacterium]|nr:Bax inhibitor-1 family protein [Spirochaetota bacterium]
MLEQDTRYHVVEEADKSIQAGFIKKTYGHLAGAILAFVVVEFILFQTPLKDAMISMLAKSPWSWLMVLGLFMIVGYVAEKWAHSNVSAKMQYAGLGVYILAEAIIFLPLLYRAQQLAGPTLILNAAILTAVLFTALTYIVFSTGKDFSFLGGILKIAAFIALAVIILSIALGFTLGLLFSALMVIFASGAILYTTSQVLREYAPSQHVGASLALFASVALLFWYILRILIALGSDD